MSASVSATMTSEASRSVELYRQMMLIRRFEERALELRKEGRIYGVVHP